jgi:AcrR family transcriptional regulator
LASEGEPSAIGLRERKKAKTRAAIQQHALRLFRDQGYSATTVTQIAEAAEISESTFFRYFPTKEHVILEDEFDDPLMAAFGEQPPEVTPIQAMRGALHAVLGALPAEDRADIRERADLIFSVPELRAAMAGRIVETLQRTSEQLAVRMGRPADDIGVRTLAGALIGAMMSVTVGAAGDPTADYVELIDAAMGRLEAGFPLDH